VSEDPRELDCIHLLTQCLGRKRVPEKVWMDALLDPGPLTRAVHERQDT